MESRLEPATETALGTGILIAILWGIGVSLRAFSLAPDEVSWGEWMIQIVSGALAGVTLPVVILRAAAWVAARIEASRSRGDRRAASVTMPS